MDIDIRYARHIDLVYHVLGHMRVDNASDCYSPAYIDIIRKEKAGFVFDLAQEVRPLERYYNAHYDRVMLLSFLPFYSAGLDDLKAQCLRHQRFTAEDRELLIKPFLSVLEKESVFYYNYWQRLYDRTAERRLPAERYLKTELGRYARVFDHFQKAALVYLSHSMTRCGRGFYVNDAFAAMAPFPQSESDCSDTLFTILHECTHQFTDGLLKTNINMTDGSHNVSEYAVILADYYIIDAIDRGASAGYLGWIARLCGTDALDEPAFFGFFKVNEQLDAELKELVGKITAPAG